MDEKLEQEANKRYPASNSREWIDDIDLQNEAFIAGAQWQKQQSPWISVEEKLPAENEGVFFVVEWVDHGKGYFVGLYRNGYWESDHRIFPPSSQIGKVTHWMPIPDFKPKNN